MRRNEGVERIHRLYARRLLGRPVRVAAAETLSPEWSTAFTVPACPFANTSDAARAAGVSIQTLRYHEREGLLPSQPRSAAGYSRFDDEECASSASSMDSGPRILPPSGKGASEASLCGNDRPSSQSTVRSGRQAHRSTETRVPYVSRADRGCARAPLRTTKMGSRPCPLGGRTRPPVSFRFLRACRTPSLAVEGRLRALRC